MEDFIIAGILLVIVAAAAGYVIKAKKSGAKCIGCPASKACASKNQASDNCGCGCGCDGTENGHAE